MKIHLAVVALLPLLGSCSSEFDDLGGSRSVTQVIDQLGAPGGLTGQMQAGGNQVLLQWADNSSIETGFRVETAQTPMTTPASVTWWTIVAADQTSFAHATIPGNRYYYRVYAITNTQQSSPSSEISVVTATAVPSSPDPLFADGYSSSSIRLTWDNVSEESGYILERATTAGGPWTTLPGPIGSDVTTFFDTGLPSNAEFFYRVSATNVLGTSPPSNVASASTLANNTFQSTFPTPNDDGLHTSIALLGNVEYIAYYDQTTTDTMFRTGGLVLTADSGASAGSAPGATGTSIAILPGSPATIYIATIGDGALRRSTRPTSGPGGFTQSIVNPAANGWNGLPRLALGGVQHYVARNFLGGVYGTIYWGQTFSGPGSGGNFIDTGNNDDIPSLGLAMDGTGSLHVAYSRSILFSSTYELIWGYKSSGGVNWALTGLTTTGTPGDVSIAVEQLVGGPTPGTWVPHLIYHDKTNGQLVHTWKPSNGVGAGFQTEIIDTVTSADVGAFNSVAMGPGNRLHVAYYDAVGQNLRYARKDPGGVWELRLLDAIGNVGTHTSIAVDTSSGIHVAYRDESNGDLKLVTGSP